MIENTTPRRAQLEIRCSYAVFFLKTASFLLCLCIGVVSPGFAQTITVVGTRHLVHLEHPPGPEQFAHTIEALSKFRPTQVCVERMSGTRIEQLLAHPDQHGYTFQPDTHGRPLASMIVPAGQQMQLKLGISARAARKQARAMVARWDELAPSDRVRVIGLLLAGFEFHSAVLNWTYIAENARRNARMLLGENVERLEQMRTSVHEVYSLGVSLARAAGLHWMCAADALEFESAGMLTVINNGGMKLLDRAETQARFDELSRRTDAAWQPDSGAGGLTEMLRFFNGDEYADLDRRLQWETLREFDNEAGAFRRRLMFWHARTAEISAELYHPLAQGPDERVLLIIGSAHRPFTEAHLRSQPWVEVVSARSLLEPAD